MPKQVFKMLNTAEQKAKAEAEFDKVIKAHAQESGVEGAGLWTLVLPLIQKFGPLALEQLIKFLQNLPKPDPNADTATT